MKKEPKQPKEKTHFEKNGIPKIALGHMAAPCLTHRTEYGIFRKREGEEKIKTPKQKLQTIFKGSF